MTGSRVCRRALDRCGSGIQRRQRPASVRQYRGRSHLRLRWRHIQRPLRSANDGRESRVILWFLGHVLQHISLRCAALWVHSPEPLGGGSATAATSKRSSATVLGLHQQR